MSEVVLVPGCQKPVDAPVWRMPPSKMPMSNRREARREEGVPFAGRSWKAKKVELFLWRLLPGGLDAALEGGGSTGDKDGR